VKKLQYCMSDPRSFFGDRDQAFHWLDDAIDRHDVRLISLKVDHKWDNLRSDPRFAPIMQRIGLE
jgi:hypothetical protein